MTKKEKKAWLKAAKKTKKFLKKNPPDELPSIFSTTGKHVWETSVRKEKGDMK